jgi:hypothetical protein
MVSAWSTEDAGEYDATSSNAVDGSMATEDVTTVDVSVESGSAHDATSEMDSTVDADADANIDAAAGLDSGSAPDAALEASADDAGALPLDAGDDGGRDAAPSIPLCATGQPWEILDGGDVVCEGCPPEDYPFGCSIAGGPGICVDLNTDPNNCGGCDVTCASTQICQGSCVDGPCVVDHVEQPEGTYTCMPGSPAVYECEETGSGTLGWVEVYDCSPSGCYVSPPDAGGVDCTPFCCVN